MTDTDKVEAGPAMTDTDKVKAAPAVTDPDKAGPVPAVTGDRVGPDTRTLQRHRKTERQRLLGKYHTGRVITDYFRSICVGEETDDRDTDRDSRKIQRETLEEGVPDGEEPLSQRLKD